MAPGDKFDADELADFMSNAQPIKMDYRSLGTSGLRAQGGCINESTLRGLEGRRATEIYKEMGENDPSVGIILFMIQNIVRGVRWFVKDASEDPKDLEASDLITTAMHDMEMPWDDYIAENMSMIQYGFSTHELLYKRRAGRAEEPWLKSKYTDGRIGWRGIPLRSQDTVMRWEFDEAGGLTGMTQQDPYGGTMVTIPWSKMLLFRTTSYKNNPEGMSAFRRAYRPYYFKKHIEETEAIGIQRDLAGMPLIELPIEVMATNGTPGNRKLYDRMKEIVTKVRRDELEGVIMPLAYDEKGNKLFNFQLISSGGSRQFDTSKIIDRLKTEIFDTSLAGMIMLGQGQNSGGSWAMHSDKTQIFLMSLKAYLSQIKNVYNLHAIPRLLELNGMEVTDYPEIDHTPLEQVDVKSTSEAISALAMAGMPIFPNADIERRILEMLGLPAPLDTDSVDRRRDTMPTRRMDPEAKLEEIHPDTPKPVADTAPADPNARKPTKFFSEAPAINSRQRIR